MGLFNMINIKFTPKVGSNINPTQTAPMLPTLDGKQPDTSTPHKEGDEFGVTGMYRFGGFEREEYKSSLQGRNAVMEYDKIIRTDSQVYGTIEKIKDKIRAAKFFIEPKDEDDETEALHAEIVSECIFNKQQKIWLDNLTDILSYIDKGFAVFEPTWKVIDYPKEGKIWTIANLGYKSQKTMWQWFIIKDRVWCVRQIAWGDDSNYVDIPGDELLIFSHKKLGNLYEGISIMRAMYENVLRKMDYLKTAKEGIKTNAKGVNIVDVPDGKTGSDEYNMLQTALSNFWKGITGWITKPKGWDFKHEKLDFDASAVVELLKYEDQQIGQAGNNTQSNLGQSTRGAQGLHSGMQAESSESIKVQAEYICQMFQQLIDQFYLYNWGKDAVPGRLSFIGIDNKPNYEEAQKDQVLALIMPELVNDPIYKAYIRKKYDIPGGDEIEEVGDANGDGVIDEKDKFPVGLGGAGTDNKSDNAGDNDKGQVAQEGKEHGPLIKQIIADAKAGKEKDVNTYAKAIVKAHKLKEGCNCGNHSHPTRLKDFKAKRELTAYENKVQLSEISNNINTFTDKYNKEIQNSFINFILPKYKKDLTSALNRAVTDAQKYNAVIDTTLDKKDKTKSIIKGLITEQLSKGYVQAKGELTSVKKLSDIEDIVDLPSGAYGWIAANAEILTDTLFDDVKKKLVLTAINGIDNNKAVQQIVFDAIESAEEHLDKEKNIGAQYLSVKALNEGRFNAFSEAKSQIQGFQFSAILETACPLCEELDGTTFKIDDPDSMEYTPPLHPNCNCILIPILTDEEEPDEWDGLDAVAEKAFDSDEIDKYKTLKEVL